MKEKVLFSWSGGKDSVYALHKLLDENQYNVVSLYTTLSEEYKRVNFHAIPSSILQNQAASLCLPIKEVFITKSDTIEEYAEKLKPSLLEFMNRGVVKVAYGDIYLEDLRDFRIKSLSKLGMESIYPIWKTATAENIKDFIDLGYRAIITCVDTNVLDASFVGRIIDEQFVKDLPSGVDPCGENGEFHSFVYDGPIFKNPVDFVLGDKIRRGNFSYCDLLEFDLSIDEDLLVFIGEENLSYIENLTPFMQKKVIDFYQRAKDIDVHFDIVSSRRTYQEQKEIYDKYFHIYGAEKLGIPGKGIHEKGLAIDLKTGDNLSNCEQYSTLGQIWTELGGSWGAHSIDEYWHFEW